MEANGFVCELAQQSRTCLGGAIALGVKSGLGYGTSIRRVYGVNGFV